MQIIFESRDADGAQMRDLSVARMRFALRRLRTFVPLGTNPAKAKLRDLRLLAAIGPMPNPRWKSGFLPMGVGLGHLRYPWRMSASEILTDLS